MKKRTFLFALIFGFMSMFAYAADTVIQKAEAAAKAGDMAQLKSLAAANPDMAAQIAGAAAAAAPLKALEIAKAVAEGAPKAAASIAVAVAQKVPAQAADVAATVAKAAPSADAVTIAAAVAKAVPSATPESVASAVSTATGKTISTSDVAKAQSSQAVTTAIQNAVPPIDPSITSGSPH